MPANFVTWRKSDLLQQFITTKRAYFADLYAHLGHVGSAGQGQPVGVAELSQLADIDQGVHVVDEYIIVDGAVDFHLPSDTI